MTTPHIKWTEDEDATGDVAEIYAGWKADHPDREQMPEILKCFSGNPAMLRNIMDVSYAVHFVDGHLTRLQKETIATYVSALNQCPY